MVFSTNTYCFVRYTLPLSWLVTVFFMAGHDNGVKGWVATPTPTTNVFSAGRSRISLVMSPKTTSSRSLIETTRLYSTLAPTRPGLVVADNSDDDDIRADKRGGTSNQNNSTFAASIRLSRSTLNSNTAGMPTVSSVVNGMKRTSTSTTTSSSDQRIGTTTTKVGGISMTIEELAKEMGGYGRAKLAWDCYSICVDPALFFGSVIRLGYDDYETIYDLLPSSRKTQILGKDALMKLSDSYAGYGSGGGSGNGDDVPRRIEGGVATLSHVSQAQDKTTKLLLRLSDGFEVETVIIPWNGVRSTLCISSQVGCRQGCKFCATGKMGRLRSLTSDEILSQMFFARKICRLNSLPPITNVVFMGMGEPADNADAVRNAVRVLTKRELFQLSAQKVTVSTVAPTPESFTEFGQSSCVLAWSVHAANDELRRQLVPTTKYTMHQLRQGMINALNQRPNHLRTAMLEVALLKGINDGEQQADELAAFAQGIIKGVPNCKLIVNLIPYNDISDGLNSDLKINGIACVKPSKEAVVNFQKRLWNNGIYTHVRATRGDDATAACGQLATKKKRERQREQIQHDNEHNQQPARGDEDLWEQQQQQQLRQ